jgi:hypothetical protein
VQTHREETGSQVELLAPGQTEHRGGLDLQVTFTLAEFDGVPVERDRLVTVTTETRRISPMKELCRRDRVRRHDI